MANIHKFKIPDKVHSIEEMFGAIKQINFINIVAIIEDDEGVWLMVIDGTTAERINWMLDRSKVLLHKC